jgi:hypothetical protein
MPLGFIDTLMHFDKVTDINWISKVSVAFKGDGVEVNEKFN